MRKQFLAMAFLACVVAVGVGQFSVAADSANQYAGTWNGTWEGEGAGGRFDLTLTTGSDGKLSGGVSVGQDAGDYTAQFSTVTVTGNKLTAKYDFPPDPQGEILLTATFDGGNATGTWALNPKGQDQSMATGSWKVAKK
jgi:hypothetical protein